MTLTFELIQNACNSFQASNPQTTQLERDDFTKSLLSRRSSVFRNTDEAKVDIMTLSCQNIKVYQIFGDLSGIIFLQVQKLIRLSLTL